MENKVKVYKLSKEEIDRIFKDVKPEPVPKKLLRWKNK